MTHTRFSTKAANYARYRWHYSPHAIETIVEIARLTAASTVADIGSGTGILTRSLVGKVGRVYAVEPNEEMRQLAIEALAHCPTFTSVAGSAEATTLPSQSVDLITVAQALHWFEPYAARREFQRIMRPGGWLAVLWNRNTDQRLNEALSEVFAEDNGWDTSPDTNRHPSQPLGFYLDDTSVQLAFDMAEQETWEHFLGALSSDSHAPDPSRPLYPNFEQAARRVFDRLQRRGALEVRFTTELRIGRIQ